MTHNRQSRTPASALLTKRPSLIRRMFSAIAGRYDFLNHLLSFGLDHRWRAKAVRLSKARPGDRILDLCCGTGDLAGAFKQHVGNCEIVGADFARPMLAIADQKGHGRTASWVQADALMLPFRDGQFDVAAVAFGVRNFSSLPLGLAEMSRVIRQGGRATILEFSRPSGPVFGRIYDFYIHRILPVIARLFFRGRMDAYEYLPRSIMGFLDEGELAEEMAKCALTDVAVHRLTLGTVCVYIGTKREETQ